MRQKHKQAIARCIALLLCVSMVMPAAAAPEGLGDAGLCEHHTQHTPQCGYQEEITGQPCAHVHDGSCGYQAPQEAQPCTHQHDEVCGYAAGSAEIPCDMGCEDTDGDGIADHADGCAYTPAQEGTPCGHVHDESCGYAEALEGQPCTHVHDEACGYVEGQEVVPCGYVCEICAQEQQEEPEEQPEEVLEADTRDVEVAEPADSRLVAATSHTLVSGVTETEVILNNEEGSAQISGFMTTVEPGAKVEFKASYSGYYTPGSTEESRAEAAGSLKWDMQRTTEQAAAYEEATGENVIFATNGDYYNMQTGQPLGALIMEGNVIQLNNEPYFAVLEDGTYELRDAGADCSDVVEAIAGPFWLIRDGEIVTTDNAERMPRNSIGLKADGTVVTYIADGRQEPYSVGQTVYSVAEFLLAQGVVDAIYLDGGGSATYATQREGTDDLVIRNSPSDGSEREVASALLLVSTEEPTGIFDHAALSPNNVQYTPGSTIQFSAIGADTAGGEAALPEDAAWTVANPEAGSITEDGLFTAAEGYTGTAVIQMTSGGQVVGSTSVVIDDIDDLSFDSGAISLDFGETSDLGLSAKANLRDITYQEGDFQWTVENDAIGSMDGNLFTAAQTDESVTGNVTVEYETLSGETLSASIEVEVGKMPVVLLDFEPDEDGNLDQCAHYHWGSSYFAEETGGYTGSVPEIEVYTSGRYTDNPQKATISAPFVFTGNWDSSVPAADIFQANGYTYYLWPGTPPLVDYECGELKIATAETGEVRFGEASLELDYDYASYDGSSNANYYIRYSGDPIDIEGYPSELGIWIYAPEGTANYIPYIQVSYWNGSDYATAYYALTPQTDDPNVSGIDWTGWMYCYADCTNLWQYIDEEHPLKLIPGNGLVWLSYQPGGPNGGRYDGSLYFDNFRVVYGTNMDDLVNPEIQSVTLNGVELAADGSTVLDTGSVEFLARIDDPESENRSGIDSEAAFVGFDGERINADKSEESITTRTTLCNGSHTVTLTIYDKFGNSDTVTYSFTVRDASQSNPEIAVTGEETVTMGSDYTLTLTADGAITAVEAVIQNLNTDFGEPEVTFAEGFQGTAEYTETGFRKASLDIRASGSGEGTICTITFSVPNGLDPEIDFFTYDPSTITYTGANGRGYSAAQAAQQLSLSAYYTLEPGVQLVGQSSVITVYGPDGMPAGGVEVFLNVNTSIGTTQADGTLTTDAMASLSAGEQYTLTASSDAGVSFAVTCTVLAYAGGTDAAPASIHLNAGTDSATEQNITWFANPEFAGQKAVVRYLTQEEYDRLTEENGSFDFSQEGGAYTEVAGESQLMVFDTTDNAALQNQVTLTGLTPDTQYCGVVGDGTNWSQLIQFSTQSSEGDVAFLVMGDTQMSGNSESDADAIAILNEIGQSVSGQTLNFGLQTGDYVDNGGNYSQWSQILDLFGENFGGTDFVHVLGNHEYYGDQEGANAQDILNISGEDYYSVEYGNVYLAVINNSASLSQAAEWLVEDAAKSDCEWKLLSIHQPPYYTNPNGGSGASHAIIPAAADAAGIDAVFSGHDHSYARTSPMTGGQVDENGVTYFICGDLGEKSRQDDYAIVDNPEFHFEATSQEYDGLYLLVSTSGRSLTVTAYNSDGTQLDTVTMTHAEQEADGYTITFDANGGSVTPASAVTQEDGTLSSLPTPTRSGYTFRGWYTAASGGEEVTADYVFAADTTIYARWDEENSGDTSSSSSRYQVSVADTRNGTVRVSAARAEQGDTVTLTITPDSGYELDRVTVTDRNGDTISLANRGDGRYTFEMPRGNVTVEAVFVRAEEESQSLPFADVTDSAWYANAVRYVYENGIMSGTSDTQFMPNATLTRAMLAQILYAMEDAPASGSGSFADVSDGAWYAGAVSWAASAGIVSGVGDGRFAPEQSISREQFALILYRYAQYKQMEIGGSADLSGYADQDGISSWAREALSWAVGQGLLSGKGDGILDPGGGATRAEVAQILQNFLA